MDIARPELGSHRPCAVELSGKSCTPLIVSRADEALSFVREQGVVLVSANGPAARLTEFIIGEPIRGSWWAHANSHQIFSVLQSLSESKDILTCRLIGGKLTLIHRRLWPALVRAADLFSAWQLAQVHQKHTPSGRHMRHEVAFPDWVPRQVLEQAQRMPVTEAHGIWRQWVGTPISARASRRSPRRRARQPV